VKVERPHQFVTYEKLVAKDLDLYYPEVPDASGATPFGRTGVLCTYARESGAAIVARGTHRMSSVLAMATELILALLRSGQLSPAAVVPILQETHAHLLALKAHETGRHASLSPQGAAVPSWQASITPSSITCLECGVALQWLSGRHLQKHGLDARAYRRKYGIPRTQPLATPAVTARRQRLIQQQRPWEQAPTYRKAQARTTARQPRRRPPPTR